MSEKIACMVRGGEAGRLTQEAAIAFAKQTGKQLVFLHIIYPERLTLVNKELAQPALVELTWLGRLNLSMARQRAETENVKPELVILNGPIMDTVLAYLTENQVERLFLGLPREDLGKLV